MHRERDKKEGIGDADDDEIAKHGKARETADSGERAQKDGKEGEQKRDATSSTMAEVDGNRARIRLLVAFDVFDVLDELPGKRHEERADGEDARELDARHGEGILPGRHGR